MHMGRKKKVKKGSLNETLDGCNCLNCRLGRIENLLNHIQMELKSSYFQKKINQEE
jgi:hypothetical protein